MGSLLRLSASFRMVDKRLTLVYNTYIKGKNATLTGTT